MRNSVLPLILLILIPFLITLPVSAGNTSVAEIYPCSSCHDALRVSGLMHVSSYHGKDLAVDAHNSLYCANCHDMGSGLMAMKNGVPIAIPGVHNRSMLMRINSLCGECHPRELEDYNKLVHGNKTYTCNGGHVEEVIGYKGVAYMFHVCSNYTGLEAVPARACIECHDPHTPTMFPPSILPQQSLRPPPPDEDNILYGIFATSVAGLALILLASTKPR